MGAPGTRVSWRGHAAGAAGSISQPSPPAGHRVVRGIPLGTAVAGPPSAQRHSPGWGWQRPVVGAGGAPWQLLDSRAVMGRQKRPSFPRALMS